MSRRRLRRKTAKAKRHARSPSAGNVTSPIELDWSTEPSTVAPSHRVAVREARSVERLAYTRTQAAQALGMSRSTFRRLLPYLETIETPWGAELIPVDEIERLVAERRRPAVARRIARRPGRKPSVAPGIVGRIRASRDAGVSYRRIADDLNAEGTPTAHGGARWWPSTVRAVHRRASAA